MNENNRQLIQYLIELRSRLLKCLFILFVIFAILVCFSNELYTFLALPLLKNLPEGRGLIATNIVSSFFVPFELAFVTAIFASIPFFLYHLWAFIAPALYQRERRLMQPLLFISTLLFYLGAAFAYFIIFPILFAFFAHAAPAGVMLSPDISQYLDFTLKLFLIFGTLFEVPVIICLLVWANIVSREKFIKIRPYAIVSAFVMGMLLAPPDVLSQTLFAIPLWLLFEIGIMLSGFLERKQKECHDSRGKRG
ncbi:MAG TPA: twin-arginine translocase subunit TatC [Gammaproteobacteria bacterium]|nr:twin-arginine translocase subunit TatC [Gammaproteobacteria bacterium]